MKDWIFLEGKAVLPHRYSGPVDLVDRFDHQTTVAHLGRVWHYGEWVDASKYIHPVGSAMFPKLAIDYATPGAAEMYEAAALEREP